MKHIFGKKAQAGFSLVELMIVVGIIGVLATLALPRFKQFQAKAKMAEASNTLSHMYTLQQSYYLDNNVFAVVPATGATIGSLTGSSCPENAIGFSIDPCGGTTSVTPRFSYSSDGTSTFIAKAVTGAGANNRICVGNAAFSVTLNEKNEPGWNGNRGVPPIGTVCKE